MINDAVIDTNVLMHAEDAASDKWENANKFLTAFLGSAATLCVDPGFTWDESTNRSLIGQEYISHLSFGTVGFSFVQALASSGRVLEASRILSDALRKRSNQMIRNKRDRTFLRVAVNTRERILVSHDHEDFQVAKRAAIRAIFDVRVIEASDATILVES